MYENLIHMMVVIMIIVFAVVIIRILVIVIFFRVFRIVVFVRIRFGLFWILVSVFERGFSFVYGREVRVLSYDLYVASRLRYFWLAQCFPVLQSIPHF
jgi:hypothetical protein